METNKRGLTKEQKRQFLMIVAVLLAVAAGTAYGMRRSRHLTALAYALGGDNEFSNLSAIMRKDPELWKAVGEFLTNEGLDSRSVLFYYLKNK